MLEGLKKLCKGFVVSADVDATTDSACSMSEALALATLSQESMIALNDGLAFLRCCGFSELLAGSAFLDCLHFLGCLDSLDCSDFLKRFLMAYCTLNLRLVRFSFSSSVRRKRGPDTSQHGVHADLTLQPLLGWNRWAM